MDAIQFIKPCSKCKKPQICSVNQRISAFYIRSGIAVPTEAGHYNSQCKTCMKAQQKDTAGIGATEPRTASEKLAITYLRDHHIPVLPGKAVSAADVDVVAWGCVWIEVKWSPFSNLRGRGGFTFSATPKQQQRGYLAHLVLLICEFPNDMTADYDEHTFHLFEASDPVFYINGHIKSGMVFTLGLKEALKHGETRVVMTQTMMDAARDRLELIERARLKIAASLPSAS